jgi:hypothetical protein
MSKHALQKTPLVFYRSSVNSEPVRDWLKHLNAAERQARSRQRDLKS